MFPSTWLGWKSRMRCLNAVSSACLDIALSIGRPRIVLACSWLSCPRWSAMVLDSCFGCCGCGCFCSCCYSGRCIQCIVILWWSYGGLWHLRTRLVDMPSYIVVYAAALKRWCTVLDCYGLDYTGWDLEPWLIFDFFVLKWLSQMPSGKLGLPQDPGRRSDNDVQVSLFRIARVLPMCLTVHKAMMVEQSQMHMLDRRSRMKLSSNTVRRSWNSSIVFRMQIQSLERYSAPLKQAFLSPRC